MSGNPRVDKEAFGRRLKRLVNAFVKSEDNEVSGIKFLNSLFLTKFVSNNSMIISESSVEDFKSIVADSCAIKAL